MPEERNTPEEAKENRLERPGEDPEEQESRERLERSYLEAGVGSVEERADRFGHPEGEDFTYEDPEGNRYSAEQWEEYEKNETPEQKQARVKEMLETAREAEDLGI